MKTSHFTKFIFVFIALYALFFTGSYWQKKKLTEETQQWFTAFKVANPAIQSINFKNANTNLFSAMLGHYKITGIKITFKAYPKNPLNIGRVSIKHFNQQGFNLSLDDIFIKNLKILMNKPDTYSPLLNIDLNYQHAQQKLMAKIEIYNQLTHLQTRFFQLSNIILNQPMNLNTQHSQWIDVILRSNNVKVHVVNNPKQTVKSKKWVALIPQEARDLLKAYRGSIRHALYSKPA